MQERSPFGNSARFSLHSRFFSMWPGNRIMQLDRAPSALVAGTWGLRVSTCGPEPEVPGTARVAGNTAARPKSS